MRVKDFFYTIVISTITSSIIIGALIGTGILQTTRPPVIYQIKQIIYDDFSVLGEDRFKSFMYPIQNVTESVTTRIVHVYVEFNVTENPQGNEVSLALWLLDVNLQRNVDETLSEPHLDHGLAIIDVIVDVRHAYSLYIKVTGANVHGFIHGIILQEIIR